jgi:hypothetical protein
VALRYSAIRGELFEPDGCSVTPISPRAAFRIRSPAELPAGTATPPAAVVAVVDPGVMAPWSIEAKPVDDEPLPVVDDGVAVVAFVGAMGCGAMTAFSSVMRDTTDCKLTTGPIGSC